MKAAVASRYGGPDVVTVADRPRPVPGDGQVLVRVHAATVGVVDSLARRGAPAYARVHFGLRPAREKRRDLDYLRGLAEAGALRPVIDACYPLPQVTDAYRYVDAGHKRGNVVLLTDH